MKLKSKLEQAVSLYFMLVTFITVLLMVLGLVFDADRTFSYSVFASPLIYAAIGVIPVFLPKKKEEPSVKDLIIRRIVELLIIEVIVLALAFSADTIPTQKIGVVLGIGGGIVIIFVLTEIIEYLYECSKADEFNKLLEDYHR